MCPDGRQNGNAANAISMRGKESEDCDGIGASSAMPGSFNITPIEAIAK